MKKIKVNYRQNWGKDGTHYDQTITLDKSFIKYINKNIRYYFEAAPEVKETIAKSVGFSTYYDCYLEELNEKEAYNYLTLTQLRFIYYYLAVNNYDVKRVLYRNTIIKVA